MAIGERTVHLDEATYSALLAEARQREMTPDRLADELMRERLTPTPGANRLDAALQTLAAVRARVKGPVDAVELVHQARAERERPAA